MVRIRLEATLTILSFGDGHELASYDSVNALGEFSPSPNKPARSSETGTHDQNTYVSRHVIELIKI